MDTRKIPTTLAIDLMERSVCAVQVAAVISDAYGIFAWGWNHVGHGFGTHAEIHALSRSNPRRLRGATLYVCAQRLRNRNIVTARPCVDCAPHLKGMRIVWRNKEGVWVSE